MSQPEGQAAPDVPSYATPPVHDTATPEEPAQIGPPGRLVGVLFSPGETFRDIKRRPTIIFPMIVSILLSVGFYYFYMWRAHPDMDALIRTQIKKQVERSGQSLTDEQMQQRVDVGRKVGRIITPILLVAGPPILGLVIAGLFALGMILIQAGSTFKRIYSVVLWTFAAIGLIGSIVRCAAIMIQDQATLSALDPQRMASVAPTNLGAFIETTSPAFRSLLSSLDIFSLWTIIIMSIGLAAIASNRKITSGKTGTVVVMLWAVWVLVSMGFAAAFG